MPRVRIPVRLGKDGTITATIAPEDVAVVIDTVIALAGDAGDGCVVVAIDKVIALAREVGDGIVVHTPCQSADERHAIARRLAEMFLREAG